MFKSYFTAHTCRLYNSCQVILSRVLKFDLHETSSSPLFFFVFISFSVLYFLSFSGASLVIFGRCSITTESSYFSFCEFRNNFMSFVLIYRVEFVFLVPDILL